MRYDIGSHNVSITAFQLNFSDAADCESCLSILFFDCNRNLATFLCRGVKKLAFPGESGINNQAKTAATKLGNPSIRNSDRHGAIGMLLLSFTINHAKLLAKEVARGAADMNSAVRYASSSRL